MSGWLRPDWPAPPGIAAGVTTRQLAGGISRPPFAAANLGLACGDEATAVAHNRQAAMTALGLPAAPCWLRQVHGIAVHEAGRTGTDSAPPMADAAVARAPGQVLAILTADCLPVLFCARHGEEIAAAHAGWRGLAAGVLEMTLARLQTPPGELLAWLGPSIGQPSYEVGEDVRAAFLDHDSAAHFAFAATRPGHWLCDLPALARRRLAQAGLTAIYGGGFDTAADPRFYSYRREQGRTGRFASLIWRV